MAFATTGTIGAAAAGAGILYKAINGISQKAQANKIARNNAMPTQVVQPEYEQNVRDAEAMAQTGLPQQQYNNQLNAINRNQAGGLFTLSRSANPSANLASLIRGSNDAVGQLNAQDAAQVVSNRLRLMQQRAILGQQKQAAWDWNSKQRYLTNLEKEQALRGAGQQNLNSAASDAISLGGQVATAGLGGGAGALGALTNARAGIMSAPLGSQNLYNSIYGGNPYANIS